MNTYQTSEVARRIGIHPNTVRLYEQLKLIPAPARRPNGYRVFTDFHIEQLRLARMALQVEVLQSGLRKQAIEIVKTSANGRLAEAEHLTAAYIRSLRQERKNAEDAIGGVREILAGGPDTGIAQTRPLKRKEAADLLHVTVDTLRNWEMNGLLAVKRKANGYRVYTASDVRRLNIIRSLRCANYSLSAILRMLGALTRDPGADIRQVIDTPKAKDDIITVCDRLLTSLASAEGNARLMLAQLNRMRQAFK